MKQARQLHPTPVTAERLAAVEARLNESIRTTNMRIGAMKSELAVKIGDVQIHIEVSKLELLKWTLMMFGMVGILVAILAFA